ncbi:hypothetical protein HYS79_00755 [Patescibacteria group bacterium]|nr:hypothetical protein [Patescibacteria group bacterium]
MEDDEMKKRYRQHVDSIIKRAQLVAFENYTQMFPWFIRALRLSRIPFLKRNHFWVGVLQLGMLRNLPRFQGWLRETRVKLEGDVLGAKEREHLEHVALIQQEWIRIYQTIIDGVVWRVLNFNRPVLRLLSENEGPGHIHPPYADILRKFIDSSDTVLINDLSRYLRIGDLTRVTKEGKILLYELKKSGRVVSGMSDIFKEARKHGSGSISKQRHRHWTAQMSIASQSINIPVISGDMVREDHRADIVDSSIKIFHHFKAIKDLIKKADRTGFEQKEVEEGYFIEVTAFDTILASVKEDDVEKNPMMQRKLHAEEQRPEWLKAKAARTIDLSSLESFVYEGTQFPRNFTPQSVLPFSSRNCVRLMMGHLEIRVYYNIEFLKKRLQERGWQVREVERLAEPMRERTLTGEFLPELPSEDFLDLSKRDGDGEYHTIVPLTLILIALSSYYATDFLLNAIEDGFERSRIERPSGRQVTINFTQEHAVLV